MDIAPVIIECGRALGYEMMRDKQIESVAAFIQGNDTFVSLPTGYGKSLIYAVLPLAFDKLKGTIGSIVVCVSPLTSLMMDQQAKYTPRGLATAYVGAEQENKAVKQQVLSGEVQLVFISPESLLNNPSYRNMLLTPPYVEKLVAVVVDEAHCVKIWGSEFRPVFSQIGDVRSLIPPAVKMMALTATATAQTFHLVCCQLALRNPVLISLPPHRGNILYEVKPKVSLEEFIKTLQDELLAKRASYPKTIVYVRRYTDCSTIYTELKRSMGECFTEPLGYPNIKGHRLVDMYTRVMTSHKKEEILHSFSEINGTLRLLIATTAFGMGVDFSDIRQIIHWGAPSTLEEYVQETGRAGRDGKSSTAILYKGVGGRHSTSKVKNFLANSFLCRRVLLFQEFLCFSSKDIEVHGCMCCDICASSCKCISCS